MWNPFRRRAKAPVDPLTDTLYNRKACPDCGGIVFLMGPQGGFSQNIKCDNAECGSEFCVGPFEDGTWFGEPMLIQRTNRTDADSVAIYGRGYGKLHPVAEAK